MNTTMLSALCVPVCAAAALLLAACGGGGSTETAAAPPVATPTASLAAATLLSGDNVVPVVVDSGPNGNSVSTPFVSVTLCEPGNPTKCQTIDHILVDTGSTGLRIVASELTLSLPTKTIGGGVLTECMQFADGYTWGTVRLANVRLAGQEAKSVPIQLIGDPAYSRVPASCYSVGGTPENTVASFGAKGLIGIGPGLQDYGSYAVRGLTGAYYRCTSPTACAAVAVPLADQVANPVAMLPRHNNGVVLQLPAIPDTGGATATGALALGVGTDLNNDPTGAKLLSVNRNTFLMSTVFNEAAYGTSLLDSGTNTILFGNGYFPVCTGFASGFYCPTVPTRLAATIVSSSAASVPVSFQIANAYSLFSNSALSAFNNIGSPSWDTSTFIWGLPFFFGRTVWTAFEGAETKVGSGPYVAFR